MNKIKLTMKEIRPVIKSVNYTAGCVQHYNDKNCGHNRIKLLFRLNADQIKKLQEELTARFPDYLFQVYDWPWFSFAFSYGREPHYVTCIKYRAR